MLIRRLSFLALLIPYAASAAIGSSYSGTGAWIKAPSDASRDAAGLKALGVSRVHLMLTNAPEPRQRCDTPARLPPTGAFPATEAALKHLEKMGFAVIATTYVLPDKALIDQLLSREGPMARVLAAGAGAIEFDIEGAWSKSVVCGFSSHVEALDHLISAAKSIKTGTPVGITTHIGRLSDDRIPLANADFLSVQAYSRCKPNDCVKFDDPQMGPGALQRLARQLVDAYKGSIIVGLAAYSQTWPGKRVEEALQPAVAASLEWAAADARVIGMSFWSSRNLRTTPVREVLASALPAKVPPQAVPPVAAASMLPPRAVRMGVPPVTSPDSGLGKEAEARLTASQWKSLEAQGGDAAKERKATACSKASGSTFNNLAAVGGSDVVLISSEVASAFAPLWGTTDEAIQSGKARLYGFRLSASVPADTKDLPRYVDHQLQLKDGGLANMYWSFFVSSTSPNVDTTQTGGCSHPGRYFRVDRHYFSSGTSDTGPDREADDLETVEHPLIYVTNGFGARAIKTALEDSDGDAMGAAGTAYLGFGLDGPLSTSNSKTDRAGFYDLGARITASYLNSRVLSQIYGATDRNWVLSVSGTFKIYISDSVAASIEYSSPVGAGQGIGMSDVTAISLSFALEKPKAAADEATGETFRAF